MNHKSLVKLTNIIGFVSIILLIYWVFISIIIGVFGLKVFRENLTESFFASIAGIFALMFGSLIINIMFNLTRIADRQEQGQQKETVSSPRQNLKKTKWLFLLSFPLIAILLFGGDYLSSQKKEKMLIASTKSLVEEHTQKIDFLLNYRFEKEWIVQTEKILKLYSNIDRNFNYITVILADSIADSEVYLGFGKYNRTRDKKEEIRKLDYIQPTTKEEREYLDGFFKENSPKIRFYSKDGTYELFHPIVKDGKKMVLYFSDHQSYGKFGS